ncbi:MazG family protein [Prevotella brunnea]|uniref:MazG family protein n=1 Tax=Prevotella brunnea TaxID=2508867 RepID=A0A5C8GJX7_9BACT|nr:nucleoside triphosphate pyrophosphohydrolase [Prevotella brunnea]MDR0185019.1 MazG family protein [Prevotella brunnea]TXJ62263.1 MazG family protein [Prevotella brunnea]
MHTKEEKIKAFERLLDIQERLRKECPWDRKQTFESLRPNTIEETFELAEALINQDYKNICKELGDLMEHIIFYSLLGSEIEKFDVADVCNAQSDKLMFRHDFIDWRGWYLTDKDMTINTEGRVVYKDELIQKHNGSIPNKAPTTANQVESTWEQRKQMERNGNKTVLSGVPDALPSIIKAYRIQDKARNVGFDWKQKEDVWEKVEEELQELKQELSKDDKKNSTKELGDFLFSVINAARLYKLNPDNALEQTCQKFISRFSYVEKQSKKMGKYLKDMTLFEMDKLWNEAKSLERHEL